MPALTRIISRNTPGTYVNEDTYGSIPAILSDHGSVYMLGTCTSNTVPFNTPIYISNLTDFKTQTISSPSTNAAQLFFDQRSGSGFSFVRVAARKQVSFTVTMFAPGTVLTLTVNGVTVSYTCLTNDTVTTAKAGIIAGINSAMVGTANHYLSGSTNIIRYTEIGLAPTSSAGIVLGVPSSSVNPLALDVADAIKAAFVPELPQGYLMAPEFYESMTSSIERGTLQREMDAHCSDPSYYWVAVCDVGSTVANSVNTIVADVTAERQGYASPRGNSWLTYPYLVNLAGVQVPSSPAQIGVALRRARADGFIQPPAGVNYPVYGVTGTSLNVTASIQGQLNPQGINCIRNLPGRGIVVYGARTLSVNPYYRFGATRVILNVLAGSLSKAFDSVLFTLVDGQGALFSRIRQTANNFCEQLRLAGGLFGATPEEAYLVVCDLTNNTLDSLESGAVYMDVIVKPSPTMEVLNITLSRASLSTVLAEVVSSGDTAPIT